MQVATGNTPKRRNSLLVLLIVGLVTASVFAPMLAHMIWVRADAITDYRVHIALAAALADGSGKLLPHPIFQLLVAGLAQLPTIDPATAAFVAMSCLYGLTGIVLYSVFLYPTLYPRRLAVGAALLFTLVLLLVAPISILTWTEERLYIGYIVPNVYHNPTINVLKPFALLLLVYLFGVFSERDYFRTQRAIAVAVVLVIISTSAKPHFAFAYVPALMVMVGIRLMLRQAVNWKLLILGIAIPTTLILVLQYVLFTDTEQFGQIAFAPFEYLRAWDVNTRRIPRLFLSLLFPLTVYACHPRAAFQSSKLNFAWMLMGAGLIFYYFFAEAGSVENGNFIWSAQITAFILFLTSTTFLIEQSFTAEQGIRLRWNSLICWLALLLHLLCGLYWYYVEFTSVTNVMW